MMNIRKHLTLFATCLLVTGAALDVAAEDGNADEAKAEATAPVATPSPEATTDAAPKLNSADAAQISTNHKSLKDHVKTLQDQLETIRNFKGSDEELQAVVGKATAAIDGARGNLDGIIEVGKKVEWSKVPRLAERMKSELDTLTALLAEITSADALGTSMRNEVKQSKRALERNAKKLADAPLMKQ